MVKASVVGRDGGEKIVGSDTWTWNIQYILIEMFHQCLVIGWVMFLFQGCVWVSENGGITPFFKWRTPFATNATSVVQKSGQFTWKPKAKANRCVSKPKWNGNLRSYIGASGKIRAGPADIFWTWFKTLVRNVVLFKNIIFHCYSGPLGKKTQITRIIFQTGWFNHHGHHD